MNSQQAAIADAMVRERQYQQKKWGDNPHEIGAWITIVRRELREAEDAWCEGNNAAGLEELLQVASVVMACLEQHGIIERPNISMLIKMMPDPETNKARVDIGPSPVQAAFPEIEKHRAIEQFLNAPAVRRASVGPMPGDVAICLHCNDQIVFTQYGQWRHHEKRRDEDHVAEQHPF